MREVCVAYRIDLNSVQYSTMVLWWLRSTKALPVFVANRVTKILDASEVSQWKHVRTEDNAADLPTQGLTPGDLMKEELWWHGPPSLLVNENEWPSSRLLPRQRQLRGSSANWNRTLRGSTSTWGYFRYCQNFRNAFH